MTVSEAKRRANDKWTKANYRRLNIAMPLNEYDDFNNFCKENNITKNGFVREAIKEKMERDK